MEMNILPITELRTLLAAVSQHGEQHLLEAQADLQQTSFLLDEAIEKLSSSFLKVHDLINKQQTLLEAEVKAGHLGQEKLDVLEVYKEKIGTEVNAVVTGLQFQDMTSQLINRTIKRVTGLKELLQELAEHGGDIDPVQEHLDIAKFMGTINKTLHESSHALSGNLRKSVAQQDMASGEIDLF